MVLARQLAECSLDVIAIGVALNSENLEIIPVAAAGHGVDLARGPTSVQCPSFAVTQRLAVRLDLFAFESFDRTTGAL